MSASSAPVRRSPLADRHRRAGARFVAAGEWPETFGDLGHEREAVRSAAGLLDAGPFDRIQLTGERLSPEGGPPFRLGALSDGLFAGRPARLWGLTRSSALLVSPAQDARSSTELEAALATAGCEATDVSSLYSSFELVGPRVHWVLEELFPVDTSAAALADRAIRFGQLAGVTVTLARADRRGAAAFSVLVERDQAEYLWDALLHVGARHGLRPVGAAAVAED